MNNDLISRSALIKWIDDSVSQYGGTYSADMMNMWGLFKDYLINNAPTIDTRQTIRHVILNHPRFGKCDACYDEAWQLLFFDCVTKELLDKYGWTFEEAENE